MWTQLKPRLSWKKWRYSWSSVILGVCREGNVNSRVWMFIQSIFFTNSSFFCFSHLQCHLINTGNGDDGYESSKLYFLVYLTPSLPSFKGHLVLFPLDFLKDEILKPGVGNKEYLLPMETWTWRGKCSLGTSSCKVSLLLKRCHKSSPHQKLFSSFSKQALPYLVCFQAPGKRQKSLHGHCVVVVALQRDVVFWCHANLGGWLFPDMHYWLWYVMVSWSSDPFILDIMTSDSTGT